MDTYAASHLLLTSDACAAAAAHNMHAKRAHVLGCKGPFIQVDGFLSELVALHRAACEHRAQRLAMLVGNEDKALSRAQFVALLEKVQPGMQSEDVERLHVSCLALGGGTVNASELQQGLVRYAQLKRAETHRAMNAPQLADLEQTERELGDMAGKWCPTESWLEQPMPAEQPGSPSPEAQQEMIGPESIAAAPSTVGSRGTQPKVSAAEFCIVGNEKDGGVGNEVNAVAGRRFGRSRGAASVMPPTPRVAGGMPFR